MRQGRALPPSAKSFLEIAPCDQIESKPGRRPIRKVSASPRPTRQLSLSICGEECRRGIPFQPQTCRARDLVGTLETSNFECPGFSDCCPTGKANAVLRARPNQKAMVREARPRPFPLRLAAGRGAKQSRRPTDRIKGLWQA